MTKRLITAVVVILATGLWSPCFGQKGEVAKKEALQADVLIKAFFNQQTGDLTEMLETQQIRVLVVPSRSTYFLDDKGQPRGLDYILLKGWEKILNKNRPKGEPPVTVTFIPVTLEELGDALLQGRGDIAGLTLITPARLKEFAYTIPIFDNVQEVVVTRKGRPPLSTLEDLSGQEIYVVSGSAQMESMAEINQRLRKQGLAPAKVITTEPYVNHENLLEMIEAGVIPAGVVPDAFARLWGKVFKNLVIHENIPVATELKGAWAVRKENPDLLTSLNDAIASVLKKNKRAFEKDFKQYFSHTRWITNPFAKGKKSELPELFERQAAAFGMDWIQLMAQGFQESSLNPDAESPMGAVGLMQVLPSTAEWIGVLNYNEPEGNVKAGAKYMSMMMKRYAKEPEVSKENRFFFALAAYNAGPGRLSKYRKQARKLEYNPNRWFGNVERVALRYGNLETVMYVRNILNYTLAYKTAYEQALLKEDLKTSNGS